MIKKISIVAFLFVASASYAFDDYNADIQHLISFSSIKKLHQEKIRDLFTIEKVLQKTYSICLEDYWSNLKDNPRFSQVHLNWQKTVIALKKAEKALYEDCFEYYRDSAEAYTTNDRIRAWFRQEALLKSNKGRESLTNDEKSEILRILAIKS